MSRYKHRQENRQANVTEYVISVECSRGHANTLKNPYLSTSGGCTGHSEGEYCYCPSVEVYVDFTCTTCFKDSSGASFSERAKVSR